MSTILLNFWAYIKSQYQNQVRREGAHLLTVLDNCQFVDYPSVTEQISAQDKIIGDLAIRSITVQGAPPSSPHEEPAQGCGLGSILDSF